MFNLDNVDVDISGWRIVSSSGEYVVGEDVFIDGASLFLSGRSSDSYYEPDLVYENILLNNNENEFIEIYTSLDQLVDAFYHVSDGTSWNPGISLELVDPLLDNANSDSNWATSSSYIEGSGGLLGTPGTANNQSGFGDPLTNEYSLNFQ